MELIDQHTKEIMEGCKERARDRGLVFDDETLEYIVTNRDLLELSPKLMIPTLYDYWVHDVEVLKEKGKYELYPSNPYETVINTRPAISYYNDNNPDWLNVMIFYHVLAHIDFFQNNLFYRHTWDYDFTGQALSDKRLMARLRSEKGRWVDYVIEFSRGIDNLVGYHAYLAKRHRPARIQDGRLDYYFDVFLQSICKVTTSEYVKEIERYNQCLRDFGAHAERSFFGEVLKKYPEFDSLYKKSLEKKKPAQRDIMQYIMDQSAALNREENAWMKSVMQVVRNTSMFFQPQIRTKIMNEGWASYWHEKLFLEDDRISGHEVDFSRVHAGVTSMPRVGLNPYAIGMRLIQYIEEKADRGQLTFAFEKQAEAKKREAYDKQTGQGQNYIFRLRENFCDFMFINTFVDQDFVTRHKLFVVGKRLNKQRRVWEYYVKSRSAKDYRQMLLDALYHPPHIEIDSTKGADGALYLAHRFEGKPLVKDFIANTMMGIEYLWGAPAQLETHEVVAPKPAGSPGTAAEKGERRPEIKWQRVLYTMRDRKLSKVNMA